MRSTSGNTLKTAISRQQEHRATGEERFARISHGGAQQELVSRVPGKVSRLTEAGFPVRSSKFRRIKERGGKPFEGANHGTVQNQPARPHRNMRADDDTLLLEGVKLFPGVCGTVTERGVSVRAGVDGNRCTRGCVARQSSGTSSPPVSLVLETDVDTEKMMHICSTKRWSSRRPESKTLSSPIAYWSGKAVTSFAVLIGFRRLQHRNTSGKCGVRRCEGSVSGRLRGRGQGMQLSYSPTCRALAPPSSARRCTSSSPWQAPCGCSSLPLSAKYCDSFSNDNFARERRSGCSRGLANE